MRNHLLPVLLLATFMTLGCDSGSESDVDTAPDTAAVPDTSAPDTTPVDTAMPDLGPGCEYPSHDGFVQIGKVMPEFTWDAYLAGDPSGTEFSLRDFHCDPAYADYNALMFMVVAEWCPACDEMLAGAAMSGWFDDIDAAGAYVVIYEAQTDRFLPATSEEGFASISAILADYPGVIVGDASISPGEIPSNVVNSPVIRSYPSGFMIRKSDMVVISRLSDGEVYYDLEAMAADPSAFYQGPQTDTPNCGAAEEEPNDVENNTAAGAATLEELVLTDGAICNSEPDFWRVDLQQNWLMQLSFDETVGDLDFWLWDEATDDYVLDSRNQRVGSATVAPGEVFQFCGPATVQVFGYNGSTVPYTVTLSGLGGFCN